MYTKKFKYTIIHKRKYLLEYRPGHIERADEIQLELYLKL